jgi:hypothetical protein
VFDFSLPDAARQISPRFHKRGYELANSTLQSHDAMGRFSSMNRRAALASALTARNGTSATRNCASASRNAPTRASSV